ncbi:MAG: phosphoribosylaminoimidazolesuccinocarboxamide synthase [Bdellovibrionales bacterium]|nr:phosphoribosylaminoimidazolesuccinocarboxamide synthase [Bdellovibrionales bacterium]MCB0412825.1 phosphoribosylaminoimidazolesuccinocarboxamide synthase [Bdellovibrionales bacterium]
MKYVQGPLVYEGKAKKIYSVEGSDELVWIYFKDDLTAFNAAKKGLMENKGVINKSISDCIFKYLERNGVKTHLVEDIDSRNQVVRKLKIVPLEVVVRNTLAGSTAKKFSLPEGTPLREPLLEFFYKNDELNDPFINDEQAMMIEAVNSLEQIIQIKSLARRINFLLTQFFDAVDIKLVDFKIEFGVTSEGEIFLGDEITPDSCRLWDKHSQEKMDKDRFRRDLGRLDEMYLEVLNRIQKKWGTK